ncbi:MAG TPA: DNA-processing protein DprA [Flavipsychrobacter sp.]|nr:DNA-processing protein DprA [Flavipsychrobacter sp.]
MLPDNLDKHSFYNLALTFVPDVGIKTARALINRFGTAEDVFKAPVAELTKVVGIGEAKAKALHHPSVFETAEKELQFVEKNGIQPLFFEVSGYPKRLRHCDDAPMVLYYKGNADLNASKIVAVIGTRKNTDYGLRVTEHLMEELKDMDDLVVVSGLATGIDTIAHQGALRYGVQTVGVLGHGLDRIYPFTNKGLAKEMIQHGGLLSEFPSGTKPDRQNFPVRNRVVAGMSDVIIVVESDLKGGAMITAYIGLSYNREIAAFPGRIFDTKSQGPNYLIKKNMAATITNAADLLELMNWNQDKTQKPFVQQKIFMELSGEEQALVDLLQKKEKMHADELLLLSGFKSSQLASVLLQLEVQSIIKSLPGKFYRLN